MFDPNIYSRVFMIVYHAFVRSRKVFCIEVVRDITENVLKINHKRQDHIYHKIIQECHQRGLDEICQYIVPIELYNHDVFQ